ncbi:MAG: T9SS type A sorting domain-containing protein [Chitinophagales bacterium]
MMIRLLTLIALKTLLVSQCFSQANVYHPFPLDGGEWRADYFNSYCAGLCEQRRYYTVGDTIIDSLKYKKLYGDIVPEAGNSFYEQYFGGLREDTINKTIFFWAAFSPEEIALFNYDLDSGDVAPGTYLHLENDTMIVIGIDSILIGNDFHKRFNLSTSTGYPAALIEGVGWSGGLILEPMSSLIGWEVTYNLKCLKINGVLVYEDTSYTYPACDLPLGITELHQSEQNIVLYPNPVSVNSTLTLKSNSQERCFITIFDLTGTPVYHSSFLEELNIFLSSNEFTAGCYLVKISEANYADTWLKLLTL